MSIKGRANAAAKGAALWAVLGIGVMAILLAALGFLIAGVFLWISEYRSHAAAAGITGGGLVAIAVLTLLIGRIVLKKMKKPQPGILAEFTGMAGLAGRLAGLIIRRDPRKSLVLAVIAGAVAEYITSGDKKK